MKIPAELKELAQIFEKNNKELFIVGGYVRDSYLGVQPMLHNDIDLCSAVTPKELKKILAGTKFEITNINESVGVMAIHGKKRYEHATFRKEYYETESHTPDHVEFIKNIEEDAIRRDFKINAIYFNILEGTYVDPLGGIEDLKERKITTTRAPKIVLNDDPERILRLIRFACSLGLEIPEEEFYYAKQNSYKIRFISKYRLRNEFEKLLTVDNIYPDLNYTKDGHYRAMRMIGEIDAWNHILPAVYEIQQSYVKDNKNENIYDHVLNCLKNAPTTIRLAVLLHDCGKVKTKELRNNFFGAKEFSNNIIDSNLGINGLGYSKEIVEKVKRVINGYDFNKFGLAPKSVIKRFIFENYDVIEQIIDIKAIIKNENKLNMKKVNSAEKIRAVYNEMLKNKTPFYRADLNIKGDDIIAAFPKLRVENLDTLIDRLLLKTALNPKKNNKEDLLVLANKLINSNPDIFIEEW